MKTLRETLEEEFLTDAWCETSTGFKNTETAIDEICLDFESRTCENCRWFNDVYCTHEIIIEGYFEIANHKDFGCNNFKRKDND